MQSLFLYLLIWGLCGTHKQLVSRVNGRRILIMVFRDKIDFYLDFRASFKCQTKIHLSPLFKYSADPATIVLDGFEPSKHKMPLIMILSNAET